MNPQGAGAKIKEISHKIILKFLIQGLHHPYTLPSKGEIVPPISIKLQNVPTVAIDDLPPTATHTVQYQTIADSKKCMCQAHTQSHIKFQIPRDQPPKRSQRFGTVTVIRSRRIITVRITPQHTTQGTLLNTYSSR